MVNLTNKVVTEAQFGKCYFEIRNSARPKPYRPPSSRNHWATETKRNATEDGGGQWRAIGLHRYCQDHASGQLSPHKKDNCTYHLCNDFFSMADLYYEIFPSRWWWRKSFTYDKNGLCSKVLLSSIFLVAVKWKVKKRSTRWNPWSLTKRLQQMMNHPSPLGNKVYRIKLPLLGIGVPIHL